MLLDILLKFILAVM